MDMTQDKDQGQTQVSGDEAQRLPWQAPRVKVARIGEVTEARNPLEMILKSS